MKTSYKETDTKRIHAVSNELSGVFTISDLQILLNCKNIATLYNRIKRLVKLNELSHFSRGIYITENYSNEVLSSKIDSTAYLSLGTILSQNGLIGTMPLKRITAVKVGRNRKYQNSELIIDHFGIAPHLYFGFTTKAGINYADNEKAFLDTLYYYMKGHKYPFDPLSDVNIDLLDHPKLFEYLSYYKNKKFITFCKKIIDEQ